MSAVEIIQEQDLDYVRRLVESKAAIVLEANKNYLLEARLTPLAKKNGLNSIGELVQALKRDRTGPLHDSVVEAMTTNETSFFRDVAPFEALRTEVLPKLIERRSAARKLDIWCAASSSGQEPYSVAMTLLEHYPELESWSVRIHCTDLSQEMVDRTNAGKYSQLEVNRGLPATHVLKYFQKKGMKYVARDPLKKLVKAVPMNLIERWPSMGPFDVIFLRNVLIYFNPMIKRQILANACGVLKSDGFLFLGGAETTLGIHDAFERVPIAKASCYRLKE